MATVVGGTRVAARLAAAASPTTIPGGAPLNIPLAPGGLPGGDLITSLLGGLAQWGIYGAGFAVLAGALLWGVSHRAGFVNGAHRGRELVVGGLLGALVVGASSALVNFAFSAGSKVH
jgi:hypothetical protein